MNLQVNFKDETNKLYFVDGSVVSNPETDLTHDIKMYSPGRYHVLVDGQSFEVELVEKLPGDSKQYKLKIGNSVQVVTVKSETDLLLEKMGLGSRKTTVLKELKAPMPGLVVSLLVQEGQVLATGDPVLILEAMKMENMLKAPSGATIAKILVEKGQKVEKNQVLISFA